MYTSNLRPKEQNLIHTETTQNLKTEGVPLMEVSLYLQ